MFEGLLDGYTKSLLVFAGINVIAAYSFYAPFKTGQVSLGQAGSWRSVRMRRRS
jgi:hypothetical protein